MFLSSADSSVQDPAGILACNLICLRVLLVDCQKPHDSGNKKMCRDSPE